MIIRTVCNTCLQSFELLLEPSDLGLMKQISDESGHTCKCPRLCGGAIFLVGGNVESALATDPRLRDPMRLSGKELFKAVNGAGLPDEIPRDLSVVESLLKANKVEHVSLEVAGDMLYIHELYLSNGIVVHLTSGSRGAQVLKITKERNGLLNNR